MGKHKHKEKSKKKKKHKYHETSSRHDRHKHDRHGHKYSHSEKRNRKTSHSSSSPYEINFQNDQHLSSHDKSSCHDKQTNYFPSDHSSCDKTKTVSSKTPSSTNCMEEDIPSTSNAESATTSSTQTKPKLPQKLCDPTFSYESHRNVLNKIFFREKDPIQRNTKQYDEFWLFLHKYQEVLKKSVSKSSTDQQPEQEITNVFKISHEVMKDMKMRGHLFDDDRKSSLTEERLTEFQYILNIYKDFLEKEKMTKLKKLKEAQENLPIYKYKEEILNAVNNHPIVLIAGDTGCGKSTQVPQYLLSAGFQSIACTQPRRIACISLCKRVAYETQNEYGAEIGYQIRFEKSKTSSTKILFLTEGLLLRQVASDPMLSQYSVIILDEVHERHLPCDFLLGIMKCLSIQRPDLKIILMSATINIELFVDYFDDCPVIQVPGRLFPIEIKYYPIANEELKTRNGRLNPAPYIRIMNLINNKYPDDERGDLLIFLSGMTEISIVVEAAKMYAEKTQKWIVLALHSTLSLEEQDKVFDIAPGGVRKCIISTNIAETSVTIDGVRFIVDSGKVKEMSYDPNCHMQRLQEFWISRASAEQRKGRAGRTGPGVAFRMYSEKEYEDMAAYSKPEIQRVSLDSLILQMISLGLPNARKFPFIEPPELESVEESIQSLKEQGALTNDEEMTSLGNMLSRLPVEVTIGKMLIHGAIFSLVEPILSLAAALSVQSPFTNRTTRDPDIRASRQLLDSDHGDPFTLLNSYNKWLEVKADHRGNSRQWCQKRGLEEQRFYEMSKLRKQFKDLLKDSGLLPKEDSFQSSYDRAYRHGELRQLKDLKRQYHQAPKKPKLLKLNSELEGFAETLSDEDDGRIDIKDVEFRMAHDRKQVYNLSTSGQITSYKDVVCLKVIVTSGLYPRLAIADIHNSYKSDSEQLFHTKSKPFAFLHPNCGFALQPDLLKLRELDIQEVHNFRSQTPVSTRHQLVAYMSLLETTKPFLVNCLRVPAAHILLLLSHSIDTNDDFTRIVCDGWLELKFPDADILQDFISKAWQIRDMWQLLLKKTFEEFAMDKDKKFDAIQRMSKELLRKILQFFQIEVSYCVRRLLAADIKNLYVGPLAGTISSSDSISVNPVKGGTNMKPYVTYNCLADSEDKVLQYILKPWTCPVCEQEMVVSVIDKIRHKEKCQPSNDSASADGGNKEHVNPLKKNYFCDICNRELLLTGTEILKHKRSHKDS